MDQNTLLREQVLNGYRDHIANDTGPHARVTPVVPIELPGMDDGQDGYDEREVHISQPILWWPAMTASVVALACVVTLAWVQMIPTGDTERAPGAQAALPSAGPTMVLPRAMVHAMEGEMTTILGELARYVRRVMPGPDARDTPRPAAVPVLSPSPVVFPRSVSQPRTMQPSDTASDGNQNRVQPQHPGHAL